MKNFKYLAIVLIVVFVIFKIANNNMDYTNCMKATKQNYISKKGAVHIAAQCEAFIKEEIMVN